MDPIDNVPAEHFIFLLVEGAVCRRLLLLFLLELLGAVFFEAAQRYHVIFLGLSSCPHVPQLRQLFL